MFRNRSRTIRRLLGDVTPALAAVAVFGAGAWLLLAGSLPLPARGTRRCTVGATGGFASHREPDRSRAARARARYPAAQPRRLGADFWRIGRGRTASTVRSDPPLLIVMMIVLALALWVGRRRFYRPAALFEGALFLDLGGATSSSSSSAPPG